GGPPGFGLFQALGAGVGLGDQLRVVSWRSLRLLLGLLGLLGALEATRSVFAVTHIRTPPYLVRHKGTGGCDIPRRHTEPRRKRRRFAKRTYAKRGGDFAA